MPGTNQTHDPKLQSWVTSANQSDTDFPIQNLPFASFRRAGSDESFRGGVAIGNQIVDLSALNDKGVLGTDQAETLAVCCQEKLNDFMALGKGAWSNLRLSLSKALREGSTVQEEMQACLVAQSDAEYSVPVQIGDYTDFYTSINHATNIGKLFRPDDPLLPNYKWVPIGYHGRSSSIVVSGQSLHRPKGQLKPPTATEPSLAPCKRLDYELEVGIYIGTGNQLGDSIEIGVAEDHVFGFCVFNDWSARDIQGWEYQPLGPFLSKSFASTVSPWIVTMEAMAPFRSAWTRPADDPQPLPYLSSDQNSASGAVDMNLEVLIETQTMRDQGLPPSSVATSNFVDSYWTVAQMVAHHSVNGCNLTSGDFFGSGTQSGKTLDQAGALMESSVGGTQPITLNNGEQRAFLEDGDTVIMRAFCEREGCTRIGFGEAVGTILAAK